MDWRLIPAEPDFLARLFHWRDEMQNPRNEYVSGVIPATWEMKRASDKPKEPRLFDLIQSQIAEHKAAATRLETLMARLPRHFGEAKVSELRSFGLDFEPWRLLPPCVEEAPPVPVEVPGTAR